jgi:hypothetical protein
MFLSPRSVLLKDFKDYVKRVSDSLKAHAERLAEEADRPFQYLESAPTKSQGQSKEDLVREISGRDGIREGLVCVFSVLEHCSSFTHQGQPRKPPLRGGTQAPQVPHFYFGRQSGGLPCRTEKCGWSGRGSADEARHPGGEVEVPAYEAMSRPGPLADRILEILLSGVSTGKGAEVIPELAETIGVSKSAVSRETAEASDTSGAKHVPGVWEGATENQELAKAFLQNLVERGLDVKRRLLFVIDGSKALRAVITQVFGRQHPVQRCRNHKLRNVVGHLPKDLHPQVKSAVRAAWKLDATEGEQKIEQLARWLERDHPSAAASLREGLGEMFTINRLGLPPQLRRCLTSTNLIDSTHSGVRQKTQRVTNWQGGSMALRWAAASFIA